MTRIVGRGTVRVSLFWTKLFKLSSMNCFLFQLPWHSRRYWSIVILPDHRSWSVSVEESRSQRLLGLQFQVWRWLLNTNPITQTLQTDNSTTLPLVGLLISQSGDLEVALSQSHSSKHRNFPHSQDHPFPPNSTTQSALCKTIDCSI